MRLFLTMITLVIALCSANAAQMSYIAKDFNHLYGMAGFNDNLLQIHFKLYEGYVKNSNDLLVKLRRMVETGQGSSYEFGALKRRLSWEFDGMRLHELYFGNLGGNGQPDLSHPLYGAIAAQFGDFNSWKKDFIATGSLRGIGWSVLYLDPIEGRLINTWINEHDVGHLSGGIPILIMDVFEHAYMPQYGLDKAKYIETFFNNIDWKSVTARYSEAIGI